MLLEIHSLNFLFDETYISIYVYIPSSYLYMTAILSTCCSSRNQVQPSETVVVAASERVGNSMRLRGSK